MRFIRWKKPPADQLKQTYPELGFSVAQDLADGGLRHMQRAGGSTDRAVCVNRVKNLDLPQSHTRKLAAYRPCRHQQCGIHEQAQNQNSFDSSK